MNRLPLRTGGLCIATGAVAMMFAAACSSGGLSPRVPIENYPLHPGTRATIFWVGEAATADNAQIPNNASAWDENWQRSYGGVDSPARRCGYWACGFRPKENPFYFALPCNDLDDEGQPLQKVVELVQWEKTSNDTASVLKNKWIKVSNPENGKTVYAQWEDVGPMSEDDCGYVFGDGKQTPKYNAGLDLSPATAGYIGDTGETKVTWKFVSEGMVESGPWKEIITRS